MTQEPTPKNYTIDIGFNRDLLRHPSTSLAALLSQGATKDGETGNPVHVVRSIRVPSQLQIMAYDLSAPTPNPISAMSAEVSFTPALPQTFASPVDNGSEFSRCKIFPLGAGESHVFEQSAPRWLIQHDTEGAPFPNLQLQSKSSPIKLEGNFSLVHPGHFYYTILLSVTWSGDETPRNFRVDPEMITTNDPGDPYEPSSECE